jgi:hypothetical protein
MSANGQYQLASVTSGEYLYLSTNHGISWTAVATTESWGSVAMSANGKYQSATGAIRVYYSSSYGSSWSPASGTPIIPNSQYIAMSSNGKYQFLTDNNSGVFVSSEYGASWNNKISSTNFTSVACTATGKFVLACRLGFNMHYSNDYGNTWNTILTTIAPGGYYSGVAMSANGKYCSYNTRSGGTGFIYRSTDYGSNWTAVATDAIRNWQEIKMSADGKYQIASQLSEPSSIYKSIDYGATWSLESSTSSYSGGFYIAISSNAQYVLLASNQTNTLYQSITPYSNLSVTGNVRLLSNTLSVNSTGYVGIGKTSASYNLDVSGNTYISGNIYFPAATGIGLVWGSTTSQIMDDGDLRIKTDGDLRFHTANTERMMINAVGNVAIGSSTATYPLHVARNAGISSIASSTRYFTSSSGSSLSSSASSGALTSVSIYGAGAIISTVGFYASSDKRIKFNIHDLADIPSINILRYLKPRLFNFIDEVEYGMEPTWGFIAQEVKEIIPNAVTCGAGYIPNIFEVAGIIGKEIKLGSKTTTDLLKDEESGYYPLKLKSTNGKEIIVKITKIIDENTFEINQDIETDHNRIFVYGQEVTDFHSLDKDAIFTITTSAVKEIDKELQETNKRVKLLEEENQYLKQQINDIMERLTKANI